MSASPVERSSNRTGYIIGALIIVVIIVLMATKPSRSAIEAKLLRDGWIFARMGELNLLVLSIVKVESVTGTRGVYIGICGQVFAVL